MGELQNRLFKFQKESRTAYEDIKKILNDKYCWKCPMRSTRTQSQCREIHSGRAVSYTHLDVYKRQAQEAFTTLGIWDKLESEKKLLLGKDVRQVLAYVEAEEVQAGAVYRTDAQISDKVEVAACLLYTSQ